MRSARRLGRAVGGRRPAAAFRPAAGFTLIEMAVALAVLATALVLAVPALPRLRTGCDAAAHALADALEHARLRAAREARPMALEIDPGHGRIRLLTPDALGLDSLLEDGPLPLHGATLDADSSAGGPRVRFSPLGRAQGGPFLFADSGQGRTRAVLVDSWTGRPRVEAR